MPIIKPISDLRNYGNVLEDVSENNPVYLTRNGQGAYVIRDIKDENKYQQSEAMLQLFIELNNGLRSSEENGWISEEDMHSYVRAKSGKG